MTSLHDPEAADPPIGEHSTAELGALLRESRISLGRDLEDVAAELRIRLVYLQAIEEGRLEELPGVAYATGFLRAYGDFLGLDGDDLVRRFKAAGISITQSTDLQLPSPVEEGRLPTGSVLLVAALLAVGAYGGWYYMSSQGRDPIENVSALPNQIAELVGIEGQRNSTGGSADATTVEPNGPDSERPTAVSIMGDGDAAASPPPEPVAAAEAATAAAPGTPPAGAATPTEVPVVAATPTPASGGANHSQPPPPPSAEPQPTQVADSNPSAVSTPPDPPGEAPPLLGDSTVSTTEALPEAETTVVELPPIPPKRKPIHEARASAPPVEPPESREAPAVQGDAPAASTIVAAAGVERASRSDLSAAVSSPSQSASASVAHRVVLRANTDTWVEVGAAEEAPVLSRLLRQGETFVVPPRPGMMMATGNAGGIEILVDGKAVAMLGPVGQVRKNVVLDAESLLEGRHVTR